MGKRPAEVESFVGNMGSMQREDGLLCKEKNSPHGNRTRTNSSARCCKSISDERSAGNPHATIRGSRRWATASGHPVRGRATAPATRWVSRK